MLEGLSLLGIDTAQLSLSALFKASSSASLFIFLARSISLIYRAYRIHHREAKRQSDSLGQPPQWRERGCGVW